MPLMAGFKRNAGFLVVLAAADFYYANLNIFAYLIFNYYNYKLMALKNIL